MTTVPARANRPQPDVRQAHPPKLHELNRDTLAYIAVLFAELANEAQDRIAMIEWQDAYRAANRELVAYLNTIPAMIDEAMTDGASLAGAVGLLETAGLSRPTILVHWNRAQSRRLASERWARDRRIMNMAARGWSNREIASAEGFHPTSISRIIQRRLKDLALAAPSPIETRKRTRSRGRRP